MAVKKVAPHGTWESPISVDSIVSYNRSLSAPRVNPKSGRAFYVESTPKGRKTIIEITKDGMKDILPEEYSVVNQVYEYGGATYDVLPDDRLIFSNKNDSVYVLNPDSGKVSLLIESPILRYASFTANSASPWVVAIEEDHTYNDPYKVENYIVAINVDTKQVKRIITGRDFYYRPQFSWDGSRVSWLEWDHPELPFTAGELNVADWSDDGSVMNTRCITGKNHDSVAEPLWGPDGTLYFGKEAGSHRQLFRIPPKAEKEVPIELLGLEKAEFGSASLFEGMHTYAPLTATKLVATAVSNGVSRFIVFDVETGEWRYLADTDKLCSVIGDVVARLSDTSALVIGSGTASPNTLYRVNVSDENGLEALRTATDDQLPANLVSAPEALHIRSKGSPARDIHGFLWMPRNPKFTGPDNVLPPLILVVHGGPTGNAGQGLSLRTQYFTSRGYALLQLNYTGSTGYGREYRESLFGNWGVVDSDDAAEAADHLIQSGRVRAESIGITGISAGGYNTLQVVSMHPDKFTAGVCVAGISDLETFDNGTHKLESDYADALVIAKGTKPADRLKIYHERSAMYHVNNIKSPLLLLHGVKDTVVPVQQARVIADALKKMNRDVAIMEVEEEGHMMGKPSSVKLWLEEEEKWWQKTLIKRS